MLSSGLRYGKASRVSEEHTSTILKTAAVFSSETLVHSYQTHPRRQYGSLPPDKLETYVKPQRHILNNFTTTTSSSSCSGYHRYILWI